MHFRIFLHTPVLKHTIENMTIEKFILSSTYQSSGVILIIFILFLLFIITLDILLFFLSYFDTSGSEHGN